MRRDALARALEKDAQARTPSVRAFLEAFLGSERARSLGLPSFSSERASFVHVAPRSRWLPLVAVGVALAGVAVAVARMRAPPPRAATDSIPDAALADAGTDTGELAGWQWIGILTGADRTVDAAFALGPPDGHCATIEPGGKVLLELPLGTSVQTDGTAAPDIEVRVQAGSAPYRVDVLQVRNQVRTRVGADVVGDVAIDVDQFDQRSFRYLRIKHASRSGTVCVDAVRTRAAR